MKKWILTVILSTIFFVSTGINVSYAKMSDDQYYDVTRSIIGQVSSLKDEFTHFVGIDSKSQLFDSEDKFWVTFQFDKGVNWVVNPEYTQGAKVAQTVKSFTNEEGISLSMYFYKGPWLGDSVVKPFTLEDLNIVIFAQGKETEELTEIRKKIGKIVMAEIVTRKDQE